MTAQFSLRADLQRDPRDLCSKCTEPDNHPVDGVLQIQDFTTGVDIDLLGQVSQRDGFGDRCNASDLTGQVGGKFVDRSRQFAPSSFDVEDQSLTAQLAFRPDFLTDTSDLLGEFTKVLDLGGRQVLSLLRNSDLTYHGVYDVFQLDHHHTLNGNGNLL